MTEVVSTGGNISAADGSGANFNVDCGLHLGQKIYEHIRCLSLHSGNVFRCEDGRSQTLNIVSKTASCMCNSSQYFHFESTIDFLAWHEQACLLVCSHLPRASEVEDGIEPPLEGCPSFTPTNLTIWQPLTLGIR